jgi:hypothetical protein
MKALTIRQPWASLIAHGVKTIETRSWSTKHRGPIAIHAGTVVPADGLSVGRWSVYRQVDGVRALDRSGEWHPLPLGAVVAIVELDDCRPIVDSVPISEHDRDELVVQYLANNGLGQERLCLLQRGPQSGESLRDLTDQLPYGEYVARPRHAWLLDDITPIDPVPAKGKQGLWEWTP